MSWIEPQDSASSAPLDVTKGIDFAASTTPKVSSGTPEHESCCFPPASPQSGTELGKQESTPKGRSKILVFLEKTGAGEGIRTLDPNLGKVVLYP